MLGTVLLRPQRFERSYPAGGLRIADMAVELVSRLALDALQNGSAQQKINAALRLSLDELEQEIAQRRGLAGAALRAWFQPILSAAQTGIQAGVPVDGAAGIPAVIGAMLNVLKEALENMSADDLATHLNRLADIVEQDLGLNTARISGFAQQVFDRMVHNLTAAYLAGDDSASAKNDFLIGNAIESLRRFVGLEIEQFGLRLDRPRLITDFAQELKNRDWDRIISKMAEISGHLSTTAGGMSAVFSPSISISGQTGNSPTKMRKAAAAENGKVSRNSSGPAQMSWYASWFLGSTIDSSFTCVPDRLALTAADFEGKISYKHLSPQFMEHWAHVGAGLKGASQATLHGFSMENGDRVSNLVNLIWQGGKGLTTWIGGTQNDEGWVTAFKILDNFWFEHGISLLGTSLASLEKYPGSGSAWFMANAVPDVSEMFLYNIWANTLQNGLLSFFTLHNSDLDAQPASKNYNQDEGLILAFVEAGLWLSAWSPGWFRRKHYGIFWNSDGWNVLHHVLGSVVIPFGTALAGWGVSAALSGKKSDDTWDWLWLKIILRCAAQYPLYYRIIWEGHTKDGRFGLNSAGQEVSFAGYPSAENSPYKLPFAKGNTQQCIEGHHGLWRHNAFHDQLYAVDFGQEFGEPVLAMRSGIVERFSDSARDGNDSEHNVIVIRHDVQLAGTDRDETGAAGTRSEYRHGRQYGIRHAFNARGIVDTQIIGLPVQQGDVIMYAGDTGDCSYHQTHVQVNGPDRAGRSATIPFVFREAGVPKTYNYYTSDNEPRPNDADKALYHPATFSEITGQSDRNWVELSEHASDRDGAYEGMHIFIRSGGPGGAQFFNYKKIVHYEGDRRRATVEGAWYKQPLPGSIYKIGAPDYNHADTFRKNFVYLAGNETTAAHPALNFADGRQPYKYKKLASYHSARHSGIIQSGGNLGSNSAVLALAASAAENDYTGSFIAIRRAGKIIQYKRIKRYEGAARRVFIEGVWETALQAATDQYHIGARGYETASAEDKKFAYLSNGAANFPDGKAPFNYHIIRLNW